MKTVISLSVHETETENGEQRRVEFNFPLLTIRTKMFSGLFDRLGALRVSRVAAWVSLIVVPIVAAIGLYLLCSSLFTLFWSSAAREITRGIGPGSYLLLPGINPILPILYGWLAIVCAIAVHEGAHGIIARNRGFAVKSSGLLFFLVIPIGAFVDVDEEQIARAKAKDSLRVMASGVAGNVLVAVVSLFTVLLLVNGLTPLVDGVYVSAVVEEMPAEAAGLMPEDVLVSINSVPIRSLDELQQFLNNSRPGDIVQVTVVRGENWSEQFSTSLTLTNSTDDGESAVMGVFVGDLMTEDRLKLYGSPTLDTLSLYMVPPSLAPGLVPFSDSLAPFYSHPLGSQWTVYANVFYWFWFVNVNVAVFNALPLYPLDGGRILNISLKTALGRKLSEKTISRITISIAAVIIWVLLMIAIIPFIIY